MQPVLTVSPKRASERIKKLSETQLYVKMLIYGRAGVGKTWLSCTAECPLVILSEYSVSIPTLLALYKERGVDPDILEVNSWADYEDAHRYAVANLGKYKTIVVDGITDLNYRVMREIISSGMLRKAEHDPDLLELKDYNKLSNRTMYAVKLFRDLPVDVVMTALEQEIKEEMVSVPMVTPKSLAAMLSSQFNCVGNLVVRRKGNVDVRELHLSSQINKDGKNLGGVLPQVITNPDLSVLLPQAREALQAMAKPATTPVTA